ncbi:MAG: hypothetical protein K1X92_02975 [Bacteroidia bacterium]|nr:hypothetical protein [Bacteroidia bacterium]
MEGLTNQELLQKLQEYEAIIRDQQVLIQQLLDYNKKLTEIAATQKETITSMRLMMGGSMNPPHNQ